MADIQKKSTFKHRLLELILDEMVRREREFDAQRQGVYVELEAHNALLDCLDDVEGAIVSHFNKG